MTNDRTYALLQAAAIIFAAPTDPQFGPIDIEMSVNYAMQLLAEIERREEPGK